jgi:hypothetical protein
MTAAERPTRGAEKTAMDELADRPEPGNMSATVMATRLQSLVEILPNGSPNTTTISLVAPGHRAGPVKTIRLPPDLTERIDQWAKPMARTRTPRPCAICSSLA